MSARSWSNKEVQMLLCIIGEDEIQRELDGAVRNEKVFQHVSQTMAREGFERTSEQCRSKFKKLRSEYRKTKDHNGKSGVNRKTWKWYDMMDAIYGHRPASQGRECGIDTATSLLESMVETFAEDTEELPVEDSTTLGSSDILTSPQCSPVVSRTSTPAPEPAASSNTMPQRFVGGKRKRDSFAVAMKSMQEADDRHQDESDERQERHLQLMLEDARVSRGLEAELARQHMERMDTFHEAFLGKLSQLVQVLGSRNGPVPQSRP